MPANNRFTFRNVHIYNGLTRELLGGLKQNGSVTEATFLYMLNDILLITDAPLEVKQRGSERIILPTSHTLKLGIYDVYCNGSMEMTKECWFRRIFSHSPNSGYEDTFRDGVRARDGKCVFTGLVNLDGEGGYWGGFDSAHVFPLERENIWLRENCGNYIGDMGDVPDVSKMNSCQNGLLLSASVHTSFDSCLISVNPDDGYRIIVYSGDVMGIDGKILDPICRNPDDPHHVSDELLRWHFRQSVLANIRGLGEPIFEHDFPVGSNMMGEIMKEPHAKERLELEFERRLRVKAQSAAPEDGDHFVS